MDLRELIDLSREYGADPRWVIAGGGNTSLKTDGILLIKASGFPLADIDEGGFARVDRRSLAAIWEKAYPEGGDAESVASRERQVLEDLMACRCPGEERRPSVETLVHDILPWPFIVHLHPTLANGLTCGAAGEAIAAELFGDRQEWIPYTDPGYVLARRIRESMIRRGREGRGLPDYLFLANHGVFAGGSDGDEIRSKYKRLSDVLQGRLVSRPEPAPEEGALPGSGGLSAAEADAVALRLFGPDGRWSWIAGGELDYRLGKGAAVLAGDLTPDHIVYSGPGCVVLGGESVEGGGLASAWKVAAEEYVARWGRPPRIAIVDGPPGGRGALVCGEGGGRLKSAVMLFRSALDILRFSESFGGPRFMTEGQVRFIVDWEAEGFRSRQGG